jgi:1-acyl-sn-glycerol-3-phosphate acyltransferase
VIRFLVVTAVAVPATIWYVSRILWAVYRNAPDQRCVCDWVPKKWAQVLLRAAGVRVVLENEEAIDRDAPQILVANHVSWVDVLTLAAFTPGRYVFVAKKEVENILYFGRAVRACGHIFIDRQDHQKALQSLEVAKKKLEEERPTVIMFPEGTRSATGELQPFKKGAFVLAIQTGAEIVPTAILGSRAVMPKGSFRIRPGTVTVRFGTPLPVAGLATEQRDGLMEQSRDALKRLLAAPASSDD